MKMSFLIILLFLAGCINVPTIEDETMAEVIDTGNFKCSEPYALTQDCSSFSYAKREVLVDGHPMKVAASEDGQIIFVNGASFGVECFVNIFVWNCPSFSKKANASFVVLRKFLHEQGVRIEKAVPLTSYGTTIGYYVFLESDGYTLLKPLSVADKTDES